MNQSDINKHLLTEIDTLNNLIKTNTLLFNNMFESLSITIKSQHDTILQICDELGWSKPQAAAQPAAV